MPSASPSHDRPVAGPDDLACTPSVLFQSDDATTVLLDIPRSLEEAQVLPGERPRRRIYSASPRREPFLTPDPRSPRRRRHGPRSSSARCGAAAHHGPAQSPAAQIADLMTTASVEAALRVLAESYQGPFYLPRLSSASSPGAERQKNQHGDGQRGQNGQVDHVNQENQDDPGNEVDHDGQDGRDDRRDHDSPTSTIAVPKATFLHGSIENLRNTFHHRAPIFNLIVLDPPWPNRSARRRSAAYNPARHLAEMRTLLTSIPVADHLARDGLVAVWITNKASIPELLASPDGDSVFASWGVQLAAEWTWLKITADGKPLYDMASVWRKPWEKILIAKRIGAQTPPRLRPKIIVAAPDVHSRKPNLRGLLGQILGDGDGHGEAQYCGLEVFARNLTAGWWSWGDEVLHFQDRRFWAGFSDEL
ncbi:hypothetical protein E4U19_005415 [Claviceps sp. Clav32 group G5]|nr:hypothetical protein E4U19_005415 [Claviceps sp. Clav32 group G5]